MIKSFFIFIFGIFLFSGCSFDYFQKSSPAAKHLKFTHIKGTIDSLSYVGGKYCYEINAIETSNNKLKFAKFCSVKFYYNRGDLVYATFINKNIKEMILIKSKFTKKKVNVIKKGLKRRKTKVLNILIPQEEKITF